MSSTCDLQVGAHLRYAYRPFIYTTATRAHTLHTRRTFKLNLTISLLQPPPEVYNQFDDLILMSQG